jgi:hypothetical protein
MQGVSSQLTFLDDTGAGMPSIYEQDDLPILGLFGPGGAGWGPAVRLTTAGGIIWRPTVYVNMRWMVRSGAMLSAAPILQQAAVNRGFSTDPNAMRLSGMSLRMQSFTATAPDGGSGHLHLADKRNGIVTRLPVV